MTKRKDVDELQHLTRNEAATALRVSLSTVDRLLKDGTLGKVRVGKRLVRIPQTSVDELLAAPLPTESIDGQQAAS